MTVVSGIAIYFIIWWLTLFCILPIGVKNQVEAGERVLGTDTGAPVSARLPFKLLLTSLVAGVLFGVLYVAVTFYGFGFDDLPHFVPEFR